MKKLHGILLPIQVVDDALQVLRKMRLVNDGYQFRRTDRDVLLPLLREPSETDRAVIREQFGNVEFQSAFFGEAKVRPRNLQETVRGHVPDDLISKLPRSFDIIGDIAVLELPQGMEHFSSAIGNGILKVNPHIRLVLGKSGDIAGTFRTRKFEVIAGVGDTRTIHREFSCRYHIDVATVYFNPRISHERMRIAQEVKQGEWVVDMFAGVGPYSILIAKQQPQSKIYSVDINPAAIKYLKENALTNGVADRVIPMLGDARRLAGKELQGFANRVIMNLPSEARNYLDAATQILKDEGGTIHYYTFTRRGESTDIIENLFQSAIENQNRKVESFRFCRVIKEIAPNRVQVAIDALVR
jgi:tRNA (guanine37-N1)-methyltransferase